MKLLFRSVFVFFFTIAFLIPGFTRADSISGSGASAYYYYDTGHGDGTLDLSGGTAWTITLRGIRPGAVTGDRIFDFVIENIDDHTSTVLLPLRVFLNNSPGAHLLVSNDVGYVSRSQQTLSTLIAPDSFDLRIVINERPDGHWNVMPYFRVLPLGMWTPFTDGAWVTASELELKHVRLGVVFDSGTDGTLLFHAPEAVEGGIVFDSHFLNATAEGRMYVYYTVPGDPSTPVIGMVTRGIFTSTNLIYIPDPENYGFEASGGISPGVLPQADVLDHGTITGQASWAIHYFNPEPASPWNPPWHSVLYGDAGPALRTFHPDNDGTGGIPDIMYTSGVLIYDGIYHSVNHGNISTGDNKIYFTGLLYEVGMNHQGQNVWSTIQEQSQENAVLVAEDDINLKGVNAVYGDIYSNDDIYIWKGYPSTIHGNLIALDRVRIHKNNTIVGNVYAGSSITVYGSSTITGRTVEDTLMPPFFMLEPSFTGGTTDINIPYGDTLTLPPGQYHKVHVNKYATIILQSGTYYVDEFVVEKYAHVNVNISNGKVYLNIARKLKVRNYSEFTINPVGPDYTRQFRIAVAGEGKIKFGRGCTFRGELHAPKKYIRIKRNFKMKGVIRAYSMKIGRFAILYHHDAPYTLPKMDISDTPTEELALPLHFDLEQNFPNPFNPSTTITYSLPTGCQVKLQVFDILGQEVATLVDKHIEAGIHKVTWNGKDKTGRTVSSGIYIYRISAIPMDGAQEAPFVKTRRMIFMK